MINILIAYAIIMAFNNTVHLAKTPDNLSYSFIEYLVRIIYPTYITIKIQG